MPAKKKKHRRINDLQWQRKTMVIEILEKREMLAADLGETILGSDVVSFAIADTPLTPRGVGDYDGNGRINAFDFLTWQRYYQSGAATADGNEDGVVDNLDLQLWSGNYGKTVDQALNQQAEARIDRMFTQSVGKLGAGIKEIANQSKQLAQQAALLPVIGERIADSLNEFFGSTLQVEIPEQGFRDYFESLGFEVEKFASPADLLNGNLVDLLVLSYQHTVTSGPFTINANGTLGDPNGLHLELSGGLTVQPSLTFDFTIGLDAAGSVFIQEGSSAKLSLIVDMVGPSGLLQANVTIPKLTTVNGTAGAPAGKHVVDSGYSLLVSDFDNIPNERLYVFAEEGTSLKDLLIHEQATDYWGSFDLEATLALKNPLNQLPQFVRNYLADLTGLPANLDFSAGVHYDVDTQELEYKVNRNSLTSFVEAFRNSSSIEDALFNLMLDKYAESTPIPESAQLFLGTTVPLLNLNVMDLLDVPRPVQYFLAPAAFRGHSKPDATESDGFKLNFDLFTEESLENLLSGNTYDIFSVDIDKEFNREFGDFTVMPETILASYMGIVNLTLEVVVEPGFFVDVDMTMGIDSDNFYVIGDTPATADTDPHLALGGVIFVRGIVEADLLFVVDFARLTVGIGLKGFGGLTFVSPDVNNPKMRLSQILDKENIDVMLGVDALLDITGEVGLVDTPQYKRTAQANDAFEIYRSGSGTSLADLERRLLEFKEDLKTEGRTLIFQGAAAGEPNFVVAAAYLLYIENQDLIQTGRDLVVKHGVNLIAAARALLDSKLGAQAEDVIKLFLDQSQETKQRLSDVVKFLSTEAHASAGQIAKLLHQLTGDLTTVADLLWQRVVTDAGELIKALYQAVPDRVEIYWTVVGIPAIGFGGGVKGLIQANLLSPDRADVARFLWNEVGAPLSIVAEALDGWLNDQRLAFATIFSDLKQSFKDSIDAVIDAGFIDRNAEAVARFLLNTVKADLGTTAQGLVQWLNGDRVAGFWAIYSAVGGSSGGGYVKALQGLVDGGLLSSDRTEVAKFLLNSLRLSTTTTAATMYGWLPSDKLVITFWGISDALGGYSAGGYVKAIEGLVGANLLPNSGVEVAKFLLNNLGRNLPTTAATLYAWLANNKLVNTFWSISDALGGYSAGGYVKALEGLVGANLLPNDRTEVAKFLLNPQQLGRNLATTAATLYAWLSSNKLVNTFWGISDALGGYSAGGYVQALNGLIGAGLLTNSGNAVAGFLLNNLGRNLSTTAATLYDWLSSDKLVNTFWSISNAVGGYSAGGYVKALNGLVGAGLLSNSGNAVAGFLLNNLGRNLSTTAATLYDWLSSDKLVNTFWSISNAVGGYSAGGYVKALNGLIGAGLLSNDSYEVARFLLNNLGRNLATTAATVSDWLGGDPVAAFWAIAVGANRGYDDGLRGVIGAGFVANNYTSALNWLTLRIGYAEALLVVNRVF